MNNKIEATQVAFFFKSHRSIIKVINCLESLDDQRRISLIEEASSFN